jgi:RNA-directed DNA polymerase
MPSSAVISALARSLLAGEPSAEAAHARMVRTLGRPWRWLQPLASRYVGAFNGGRPRPRHRDVVQFLIQDPGFQQALSTHRHKLVVAHWLAEPPRMQPVGPARAWNLPVIEAAGDLARWLSVHHTDLDWFADLKGLCSKLNRPKLEHYCYRILTKRSGGVRLIESPKRELKEVQRRILSEILDRIPAHPAAHGFVRGRSIATFASPHTGKNVVLRLDLEHFFPAFPAARAQTFFRTIGYPERVADLLGGICSNATPASLWKNRPLEIDTKSWQEARILYTRPHLPQGAPTSPALANLTAYRLDCRLSGLAKSAGAVYTRYADDLAFSGGEEFSRIVKRFSAHAAAIAIEEGFNINHHKTRFMRQGVRQTLAGVVVNEKPNLRRADFKILEAILTNCVRFGPTSQNRRQIPNFREHLEGRIGFVEMINRVKGRRLRKIFETIRFS